MKFPRNARVVGGNLDIVPYASVFFVLVLFVLLGTLMYTPGVYLSLPAADDLPGVEGFTLAVALDSAGQYYYQNQQVPETELKEQLRAAERGTTEKITLTKNVFERTPTMNCTLLSLSLMMSLALLVRSRSVFLPF